MLDLDASLGRLTRDFDPVYRRHMIRLRWGATLLFIALGALDVFPVSTLGFVLSSAYAVAYHTVYTIFERRGQPYDWFVELIPFFDSIMVSAVMLALGQPTHPMWSIYGLIIMGVAPARSSRYVAAYTGWVLFIYGCVVAVDWVFQGGKDWRGAIAVAVGLVLIARYADMLASSERRLRARVKEMAGTDGLTGLANRHRFHEMLEHCGQQARRSGQPFAIIMVDVDNLKELNDRHGHLEGDRALRELAAALLDEVRESDIVARYGGDEFVVLAYDTDLDGAERLAERIRARADGLGGVSASFGCAAGQGQQANPQDVLSAADEALYRAKREGKNRVRSAGRQRAA